MSETPRSEWRSQYKVRDVVAALLLLDQDADVWEYADPGGECPLHSLPRVKQVAWRCPPHRQHSGMDEGYWHTILYDLDESDTNIQTVVMI